VHDRKLYAILGGPCQKNKESGARIQESGEIVGIMENWNNGMMVLGARKFLNIIGSVTMHSKLNVKPIFPTFRYSNIPQKIAAPLFFMLEMTILPAKHREKLK
jgi:hypothetical protein